MKISSIITLYLTYLLCLPLGTPPEKRTIRMRETSKNFYWLISEERSSGGEGSGMTQLPSSGVWRVFGVEEEWECFVLWDPGQNERWRKPRGGDKCGLRPYDMEVMGNALQSHTWGPNSDPVPSVGRAPCPKPVLWGCGDDRTKALRKRTGLRLVHREQCMTTSSLLVGVFLKKVVKSGMGCFVRKWLTALSPEVMKQKLDGHLLKILYKGFLLWWCGWKRWFPGLCDSIIFSLVGRGERTSSFILQPLLHWRLAIKVTFGGPIFMT